MGPAASSGARVGRGLTPGAPALVWGHCTAVRAPGLRQPSWDGLGARWAEPLQRGQGGRSGRALPWRRWAAAPPRRAGEQVAGRCAGWGRGRKGPAGAAAGRARPRLLLLLLLLLRASPLPLLPRRPGLCLVAAGWGSGPGFGSHSLCILATGASHCLSFLNCEMEELGLEIFVHTSAPLPFVALG